MEVGETGFVAAVSMTMHGTWIARLFDSAHGKRWTTGFAQVSMARPASSCAAPWPFISLLVGAFVASLATTCGGRQRDSRCSCTECSSSVVEETRAAMSTPFPPRPMLGQTQHGTQIRTALRRHRACGTAVQRPSRLFPDQIARTSGTVHNTDAEAPSASGSIEPLRSVSHAPTNVAASPIA